MTEPHYLARLFFDEYADSGSGSEGTLGTCRICEIPHRQCSRADWTEVTGNA